MQAHGCAAGWKRVGCLKQGLDLSRAAMKKPDAILEFRERQKACCVSDPLAPQAEIANPSVIQTETVTRIPHGQVS